MKAPACEPDDYDAYKHLCILTLLPSLAPLHLMLADTPWPRGFGATLTNVGPLGIPDDADQCSGDVHCPRASNGLLPRRSNLVGYVRWDAQSDPFPPCQTIIPTAFRSQPGLPVRTQWATANRERQGALTESRTTIAGNPFDREWLCGAGQVCRSYTGAPLHR